MVEDRHTVAGTPDGRDTKSVKSMFLPFVMDEGLNTAIFIHYINSTSLIVDLVPLVGSLQSTVTVLQWGYLYSHVKGLPRKTFYVVGTDI